MRVACGLPIEAEPRRTEEESNSLCDTEEVAEGCVEAECAKAIGPFSLLQWYHAGTSETMLGQCCCVLMVERAGRWCGGWHLHREAFAIYIYIYLLLLFGSMYKYIFLLCLLLHLSLNPLTQGLHLHL